MTNDEIENLYWTEEPTIAQKVLTPLAEAGNTEAQFYLGHLCDGESPRDQISALKWYKRASDAGHVEATHYLASFIYHGFGAEKNVEEAVRLFRQAALAGSDASQWKLGQHLLQEAHRSEAIEWLKMAAAQGNEAAIDLLDKQSK